MNAGAALASPWYCAALRRTSALLERLAHRLDAAQRRPTPDPEDPAPHELLRLRESAEEELREIRLRSLRYY
jgi:hypothetical protein